MSEETVADRRVHPATVPLRFLKEVPSNLIGLPAVLAVVSDIGWASILLFAVGVAGVTILVNWLSWRRFLYGIGAREVVIESGLFTRNRRSIPFARIQDVGIERGPLQRLFGLAKVRIETGGSDKDEGLLDSVSLAEADRLRLVLRAARAEAASLPEEVVPEVEARTLFAMPLSRVFVSGLFNFSLLYLAGLAAFLQAFDDWLPFDIYDPARWIGLVDAQRSGGFFTPGRIAAVLFLAFLLGVLTGVLRIVSRDFGFRLTVEEGTRFRRQRGLFTRTETVVPKDRIRLALVRTGPVRRLFGAFDLSFQTLGAGEGGASRQSVAPFARREDLEAILAETDSLRLPESASLVMVSKRHAARIALAELLVPLPAILLASVFFAPALLLLAALPLPVGAALLTRRFHRYALTGGLLFVRRGMWRQQLWIVPHRNVEAIRLTRTFLQRRLGLASLLVDTAGAAVLDGPRIIDVRLETARALVAEIAERLHREIPAQAPGPSVQEAGQNTGSMSE